MAGKFRHELKYYINMAAYYELRHRLSTILSPDENADEETGDYHIRSLYFDDWEESSLMTKIAGSDDREKFRVRIYNMEDTVIRLERKIKKDQYILKHSCAITRKEFDMLINGDGSFLLQKNKLPAGAVYFAMRNKGLRPVTVVDYVREAYIHPIEDVRITFDKDLRAGVNDFNIFDKHLFTIPMLDKGIMVLEIKFNQFLPGYIRRAFDGITAIQSAVSKYVICRKYDL